MIDFTDIASVAAWLGYAIAVLFGLYSRAQAGRIRDLKRALTSAAEREMYLRRELDECQEKSAR